MAKNHKISILIGFTLAFSLGAFFLLAALPKALAVDVNVSAEVPSAGCTAHEVICGDWDTSGCAQGGSGYKTRSCSDGCTTTTQTGLCGVTPPVCTASLNCGSCISGQQSCIQTFTSCSTSTFNRACALCDNDGVLDSGEQCDDGNISSADCCSTSCIIQLVIDSHSASPANNSATISWSARSWQSNACQAVVANAVLDWGENSPPSEGTVSLSGQTSYTITSLKSNTVYHYLINLTFNGLTASISGSFLTLGGVEICTNGIDDDHDGLIDYLDPSCPCDAVYDCASWAPAVCPDKGIQTRECTWTNKTTCWNPQPQPATSQSCNPECKITCTSCQTLNTDKCICESITPCCGNGICEAWAKPPEGYQSCPQDCPVLCLSNWGDCSDSQWGWQPVPCPQLGIQTRSCFDSNACKIPTNPPSTQRSCSSQCPGLSCGTCQQINIEQCTCEESVPCCGNGICEAGETHQSCSADCVEVCLPNWMPTGWGACVNGVQARDYQDLNNCPYTLAPPPNQRCCLAGCNIACGLCQKLDLNNRSCVLVSPCCGDRICEKDKGEDTLACPVDCGLPPGLKITLPQCLDGLDNDNDGLIDYPADPDCTTPAGNAELGFLENSRRVVDFLQKQINIPQVQQANKLILAPALVATIVVNTFATFSFFNFLSYLQFFFSQPLAAIFRRKRKKWGIVFNSLSKQPVDLAIVRLYSKENNRLVQSRVTDKQGRYSFLVEPGLYYLTATKPQFNYPTVYLRNAKEDAKYLDLYHGETFQVRESSTNIIFNIPLDPLEEIKTPAKIIFQYYLRKVQYAAAFSAVPLAAVSMAISPGLLTFTLFVFHCLLYVLFRRLGYQKPPKNWGMIYDVGNKKPVGLAVARIYDKQYNKLLETRVTDARGRYSFLVNNNIYYLTAEKGGYHSFRSSEINLIGKDREAIVGLNIGLQKAKAGQMPPTTELTPPATPVAGLATPTLPSQDKIGIPAELVPTPPASQPTISQRVVDSNVGRQSLQDLLKTKKEMPQIKQEVAEENKNLKKTEEIRPVAGQNKSGKETEERKEGTPPPEKSIFG